MVRCALLTVRICKLLASIFVLLFMFSCIGNDFESTKGDSINGLMGTYYNNIDFTNEALVRVDSTVNFNWGNGSPDSSVDSNTFSVRWEGFIKPEFSETYTFQTRSDDGVRLWVDGDLVIDNWTDHPPTNNNGTIELDAEQYYEIRLEYYENGGGAVMGLSWSSPSQPQQIVPSTSLFTEVPTHSRGLTGTYYNNSDFTDEVLVRVDSNINFNWERNSPDVTALNSDTFSVRWEGFVQPEFSETYTFQTRSDDGIRLWIDGDLIIDNWTNHPPTIDRGTITLEAEQYYEIRLEYYENYGGAVMELSWSSPSQPLQIVPTSRLFTDVPTEGTRRCAEAIEGNEATLSCPSGEVIDHIEFASYGLPEGSCDAGFTEGTCHSERSLTEVESACLGNQSCTVAANNAIFGDPCRGVRKYLSVLYTCDGDDDDPDDDDVLKVFILAGQSNMVGTGTVYEGERNGGMGTLEYLVREESATYGHLVTPSGDWAQRDDVWLVDLDSSGPLGITGTTFGPELQFGQLLGDYYDNQVLIIKIAWGGKSLAVDFRPPSSGGDVGPYYTAMVNRVHEVLADIESFVPGYDGQGYEIAGFGWHQGWNDRINQEYNDAYQTNCVNLINDLRDEFDVPNMPFVLATTGMSGWDETHPRALSLMEAQLAVPDDPRLNNGNVFAVETRDFWQDESESPADQGYHWNRNAKTYFLIGDSMGREMINLLPNESIGTIDAVYFAQTHVLPPDSPYFRLVSDLEALIKVHVISEEPVSSPEVIAILTLDGETLELVLEGPDMLPSEIPNEPGVVDHNYEDSFTGRIPSEWVQPGLSVEVVAGLDREEFDDLNIGAPNRVVMTMFDVHYFAYSPGDYADGWLEELEAKWPVSEIELRRIPEVIFEELVIPPRAGAPAARVSSRDDYFEQTGLSFDGEQAAALQWKGALQAAAGTRYRTSLYYVNIYGVGAGGQGGNFGAVGNGTSYGILHHELGHALSLPDNCGNPSYPYQGDMYGIPAGEQDTHVGPTWGFDLPSGRFITPVVQPGASRGIPGTYKADPMCGGGMGGQNNGFLYRYFSDHNINIIQNWLERNIYIWNESLGSYVRWNDARGDYTTVENNNGVQFPIERDVEVISVMAGVSAVTPSAHMIYPPIRPYVAGLIELYDPRNSSDRARADDIFCPSTGCDVSLRIVQGGVEKVYMLAISWDTSADPLSGGSYQTRAVNLPARDGEVTEVELLFTPNAERDGFPAHPTVLDIWN